MVYDLPSLREMTMEFTHFHEALPELNYTMGLANDYEAPIMSIVYKIQGGYSPEVFEDDA